VYCCDKTVGYVAPNTLYYFLYIIIVLFPIYDAMEIMEKIIFLCSIRQNVSIPTKKYYENPTTHVTLIEIRYIRYDFHAIPYIVTNQQNSTNHMINTKTGKSFLRSIRVSLF